MPAEFQGAKAGFHGDEGAAMLDLIFLVLIALLPIVWLASEFCGPRAIRVTLGILCMLVLTGAWFHSRQRTVLHNAWNAAVIRMLGEALDQGDVVAAEHAIDLYEKEKRWHPSQPALEYFDERESIRKVEE